MSAASDYVENQILDFYLNQGSGTGGAISAPSNIYLGLFTSAPSDAGGGTEVSTTGTGYGRIEITDKFDNASGTGGSLTTNGAITGFTANGANWGTINSIGIFDAITGGNLLFYATISNATVNDGDSFQISTGNLTVTVA